MAIENIFERSILKFCVPVLLSAQFTLLTFLMPLQHTTKSKNCMQSKSPKVELNRCRLFRIYNRINRRSRHEISYFYWQLATEPNFKYVATKSWFKVWYWLFDTFSLSFLTSNGGVYLKQLVLQPIIVRSVCVFVCLIKHWAIGWLIFVLWGFRLFCWIKKHLLHLLFEIKIICIVSSSNACMK